MRLRRLTLGLPVLLCGVLVGCASTPAPDLRAEMEQADEFVNAVLDRDITAGGSGVGGLLPAPSDAEAPEQGGMSLSFTSPEGVRLLGVRAACFGEGTAELTPWRGRGAERMESEPERLDCDGTEHTFMLPQAIDGVVAYGVEATLVDGSGAALGSAVVAEAMDD